MVGRGGRQQPPNQNVFVQTITENIKIDAVHVNLGQECIMITEDKAYRCLADWKSKLEQSKAWISPVSLFIPLALALGTTTFKDAFGVPKDTWQAIFLIGVVGAGIWTAVTLWNAFQSRGNQTVGAILDQLKKGAVIQKTVSATQS